MHWGIFIALVTCPNKSQKTIGWFSQIVTVLHKPCYWFFPRVRKPCQERHDEAGWDDDQGFSFLLMCRPSYPLISKQATGFIWNVFSQTILKKASEMLSMSMCQNHKNQEIKSLAWNRQNEYIKVWCYIIYRNTALFKTDHFCWIFLTNFESCLGFV